MRTLTAETTIELPQRTAHGEPNLGRVPHTFAVVVVQPKLSDIAADGHGICPPAWVADLTEPVEVWVPGSPEGHVKDGDWVRVAATGDSTGSKQSWWLGRGTVEHVLPVVADYNAPAPHVLTASTAQDPVVGIRLAADQWLISLDIDCQPGDTVLLVRLDNDR